VKWTIRSFAKEQAQVLLGQAVAMEDGRGVRRLLNSALIEAGLGALIHASDGAKGDAAAS
jgi:hypothetical protein